MINYIESFKKIYISELNVLFDNIKILFKLIIHALRRGRGSSRRSGSSKPTATFMRRRFRFSGIIISRWLRRLFISIKRGVRDRLAKENYSLKKVSIARVNMRRKFNTFLFKSFSKSEYSRKDILIGSVNLDPVLGQMSQFVKNLLSRRLKIEAEN